MAFATPAWAEPAVTSSTAVDLSQRDLVAGLEEAMATGNGAQLDALARPHRMPQAGPTHVALNTALARAWIFLGDSPTALAFARTAARDSTAPAPCWLAAEILYSQRNWTAGNVFAARLRQRDPDSPAVAYVEARRQLIRLNDADATFTLPMMKEARSIALASAVACTSPEARAHADFDPRFLSLGIDVAMFDLNYALAADHASALSLLRPRNAPLARLALALGLDTQSSRGGFITALKAQKTLPEKELQRWEVFAELLAVTPPAERAGAWLSLAEIARKDPALAAIHVHLIGRAAVLISSDDPRFNQTAYDYQAAAYLARSAPHVRQALGLRLPSFVDEPESRERYIEMGYFAGLYDFAATITAAETPRHLDDFEWLSKHRRIIARHQTPGVYLGYLKQMERLRPDEPAVLLELARVYDQHTMPEALGYYDRVFALTPETLQPTTADWFAYKNLVDAASLRQPLAKLTERFDRTIERIHVAAPNDVTAACFYAELLMLKAVRSKNPEYQKAAAGAVERALNLDPESNVILQFLRPNYNNNFGIVIIE
ncbi:MAG: hypothetical protein ABW223_07315 [Rariglobus sp.]